MNAPSTPGGRIDESLALKPVRIAVLTISDTRDEESDTSGHVLAERVNGAGHELADKAIVRGRHRRDPRADRRPGSASGYVEAIVTTGGTGITGRDVTPEAVEPLFDKKHRRLLGGLPHGQLPVRRALHPAVAGARPGMIGGVFVFCLPGSNGAVKDGWDKVISAQLDSRHGPCNMVELMPRLLET